MLGTFGFLASTVLTVTLLLCVGELSTDTGCEEFLRKVGRGTRAPYLLFMAGCAFAVPAVVRYAVSSRTLPGLIIVCLVLLVMSFMVIGFSYFYVSSLRLKSFLALLVWKIYVVFSSLQKNIHSG